MHKITSITKKVLLFSLLIATLSLVFKVPAPGMVAADDKFSCTALNYPREVSLPVDPNTGNKIPQKITITVRVYGTSSFGDNNHDGIYESGYRLANNKNGELNYFLVPLEFRSDSLNPGEPYYVATAQLTIDSDVDYNFVVETDSAVHLTFGDRTPDSALVGQECRGNYKGTINVGTSEIITGSCATLGYPADHATCEFGPNGLGGQEWKYNGIGECADPNNAAARCSAGGRTDDKGNYTGTFPNPLTGGSNVLCVTCTTAKTPTFEGKYGDVCNNSDLKLCSQNPIQVNGKNQILICKAAPGGGEKCLFPDKAANLGSQCTVGANECQSLDQGGTGLPLRCKVDGSNTVGTCQTNDDLTCSNEGPNEDCVKALGAGAQCKRVAGQLVCAPADVVTPPGSEPGGNDGVGSDDFGRGNCPYVDPTSAKVDLTTGDTVCTNGKKGCSFRPLPLCGSGEANGSNSCATFAQRTEFYSCSRCTNQGNTWVGGIGCVNTTPEGIFVGIIRIALGVMGGVALLRMIYLGYVYQTGDEGKIKEARQGVIGTLAGLLLALFSVLVLRIIGVNVLDVVPAGFFGG